MASIYESAQNNYLRSQGGSRITQSQHDAARRYANANNMDYDPNKGYGAKGSFKTPRADKVRSKGQSKGGAMGFAALGDFLMGNITADMTPEQKTIEMGRRFGGTFTVDGYDGYNPYKLPGGSKAAQQRRQMAIASFERGHGYTPHEITYGKNGSFTARDVSPKGLAKEARRAKELADRLSKGSGSSKNSLMGSVKPRATTSISSNYAAPARNTSFLLGPSITLMGRESQPNKSRLDIQRDALQDSFNGITI